MGSRIGAKIILLFLFFAQYAHAANLDSLKRVLSVSTSDEQRANLFLEMGKAYESVNPDSALFYFHRALTAGRNSALNNTCYRASSEIADHYYGLSQFDSELIYNKLALQYARLTKDKKNLRNTMLAIAGSYLQNDNATSGIAYADSSLRLSIQLNDSVYMGYAYNSLSNGYTALEDYTNALDAVVHASAIFQTRSTYSHHLGESYMIAANILDLQKKYTESLKFHELAKKILIKANDTFSMPQNEVNTAIVYSEMGDYKKAIDIFKAVLPGLQQRGPGWATTCLSLAIALAKNGDHAEAERMFQQVEKTFTEGSLYDPSLEGQFYAEFADMYLHQAQYDKALFYAKKNEKLFLLGKLGKNDAMQGMKVLADIYHAKGDAAMAYNYYVKYSDLKDTIAASQQNKNYAQAEAKFNLAERNKTIELLSKQNELQKKLSNKDRVIKISLIFILVLALVFAVIGFNAYRRTLKRNALLNEQREIITGQVEQLANAAMMKSKFLANISHELRTPVTILTGMLELMSKTESVEAKERERIGVAYNNSRKLQHMVEEILDLTKLEHKVSAPVYETKETAPMLKRMVYTFETLIEKDHLTLQFEDTAAKGVYISIDLLKFEKVINNLMYNAIKFNKPNGNIKVVVATAGASQVEISISDTGIGIAAADLPHIFEHFYQSETSGMKAEGAGIGLSLVKEFTELMGGTVTVASRQGSGSSFKLTFPQVAAPAVVDEALLSGAEEVQPPTAQWHTLPRRQNVLIAEDNREMQYYLKEVLGDEVNIILTGDGYEALEWLAKNIPDLIISDIMMPGMDGRELVTYLKSQERFRKIPIITLTALADVESRLSVLRLGIDDYMVKPFNADELRIRVYNLLRNSAERDKFNREETEPGDIADNGKDAEEFMDKVKTYVLSRIKDMNITVYDLAYEFSVSDRQLQRMSKSLTGCTPAQLIKEVRLQKAYELLLDENSKIYKVDDVCKRVGYDTASYFARQFYERFGKRPSDFL